MLKPYLYHHKHGLKKSAIKFTFPMVNSTNYSLNASLLSSSALEQKKEQFKNERSPKDGTKNVFTSSLWQAPYKDKWVQYICVENVLDPFLGHEKQKHQRELRRSLSSTLIFDGWMNVREKSGEIFQVYSTKVCQEFFRPSP